jgi:hypothetical protein
MFKLEKQYPFSNPRNLNTIFLKLIYFFAFILLIIAYFSLIQASASPSWDTDYKYLYCLAKQSLTHCNPYKAGIFFDNVLLSKAPMINLNSPFTGILVAPFGVAGYSISFLAWSLQSLILTIFSACLIAGALFQKQKMVSIYFISALLVCAYFPTFANVKSGQIGALLFFFTTLGWLSYREEKLKLAGFFWGIAFSLKLFAGLFLWMFFLRREWLALKLGLFTVIGCLLLSFLVFSPGVYIDYWHIFHQVQWYSSSWNASLLGFFARLFGYHHEGNIPFIKFSELTPIFYGASITALLLLSTAFRKSNIESAGQSWKSLGDTKIAARDLAVSYIIVAMLLISPLGWIYYFSLLSIPIAVIFYWNQRIQVKQLSTNFLLATVVALSSAPYLLLKPRQINQSQDIFLQSGLYFYALCLLILLIFKLHYRLKQRGLAEPQTSENHVLIGALCVAALLPSFLGIFHITHLIIMAQ